MENIIENKVATSGLQVIDLSSLLKNVAVIGFDLKDYLFQDLILKEKDFRLQLKNNDWSKYSNAYVAIYCSTDALIPVWAYMLVASYLQPVAKRIKRCAIAELYTDILISEIESIDYSQYKSQRVVIKGCSSDKVNESAYVAITSRLIPIAQSVMYGEPCSTVPIYKRKND